MGREEFQLPLLGELTLSPAEPVPGQKPQLGCHGCGGYSRWGALGISAEAPAVVGMPASGFGSRASSREARAVLFLLPAAVMRVEFGLRRVIYPTAPNASPRDVS